MDAPPSVPTLPRENQELSEAEQNQMEELQHGLDNLRTTSHPVSPSKPRCYGNTKAVILGRHRKWELSRTAKMLEFDDYKPRERATCLPAYVALKDYRGMKKLYGERLYASKYPSRTPSKGFFDLPGELRNKIYSLVLVLDEPIEFLPVTSHNTNNAPWRAYDRAIRARRRFIPFLRFLRLSRQINQEAGDVFYGENEFRFTGVCGSYFLRAFMHTIGTVAAARLRKITVHIQWPGRTTDSKEIYNTWTLQTIGSHLYSRHLQPNEDAPASRAFSDCLRMFEAAGQLKNLTLILPHAFSVTNVTSLDLDLTCFDLDILKIKLLHLRKDIEDEYMNETQEPLQKIVRFGKRGKNRRRVETEWANPKAYAESVGWEYEKICHDRAGEYPVDDPYAVAI